MMTLDSASLAIAAPFHLQDYWQNFLLWVQAQGITGAIAFVGIYALATVFLIPGSLLTLGGGAVFGVILGSAYVFLGAVLGATLAFLIGRYLARGWVAQRIATNQKFETIDTAIAREGLKIVILTRLSPVFPFTLLNYAFSLTQVCLKDYMLGFVGMLPGTVMYVYIGSLAGSLAMIGAPVADPQAQKLQWIVRVVGLIATVVVTLYITRIARKALDASVNADGATSDRNLS